MSELGGGSGGHQQTQQFRRLVIPEDGCLSVELPDGTPPNFRAVWGNFVFTSVRGRKTDTLGADVEECSCTMGRNPMIYVTEDYFPASRRVGGRWLYMQQAH